MAKEAPPDAFGNSAREYELGRPQWPEELIDRVVADLGLGADSTVHDLGAGTGKLTRSLVPRFARVIAVEPDDAMRAVLDEVVAFAKGGAPGLGKVLSGFWREPIAKAPLAPLREAEAERTVIRTRDQWLANMLSVSSIASLLDADREALTERLRDLVPDVEYRWSIRTIAYWTRLA